MLELKACQLPILSENKGPQGGGGTIHGRSERGRAAWSLGPDCREQASHRNRKTLWEGMCGENERDSRKKWTGVVELRKDGEVVVRVRAYGVVEESLKLCN